MLLKVTEINPLPSNIQVQLRRIDEFYILKPVDVCGNESASVFLRVWFKRPYPATLR